jgi:mRNA interferase RelE/StbE
VERRVEKDLERVPRHIADKFLDALDEFAKDPIRPRPGFDVKPLKGLPGNPFRLRLGDYRVLYSVDLGQRTVKITSIRHRGTAYG